MRALMVDQYSAECALLCTHVELKEKLECMNLTFS
jgi:hypothetical protein